MPFMPYRKIADRCSRTIPRGSPRQRPKKAAETDEIVQPQDTIAEVRNVTTLFLKRVGMGLHPDGDEAVAEFLKIPIGKQLRGEISQPRNLQRLKLYWVLCHRIANATGMEAEQVSDVLKLSTGHFSTFRSKKWGAVRLPKSISFAAMDETQFRDFFNRCLLAVTEELGIARPDVLDACADIINSGVPWTRETAE